MEYIRYFEEHSNHQAFIDSDLFGYAKLSYCGEEKDVVYRKYKEDPYLTFISEQDGSRVALNRSTTSATINGLLKYSTNNGKNWENYTFTRQGESYCGLTITLNENDSLMFKGTLPQTNFKFSISGKVSAKGDITSLHNGVGGDFALVSNSMYKMFHNCTGLTTAPNLPSTTLSINCYDSMFSGCTSLTTAPALPATNLSGASSCYNGMFGGCTSLTTAPALPATTLASSCYEGMFRGCTSLTTTPNLLSETLVSDCYAYMFSGCSKVNYIKALFLTTPIWGYTGDWVRGVKSTGTFVKNSAATWTTTGNNGIPKNWTVQTASS